MRRVLVYQVRVESDTRDPDVIDKFEKMLWPVVNEIEQDECVVGAEVLYDGTDVFLEKREREAE